MLWVSTIKDPTPTAVVGGSAQVQCAILIDLMKLPTNLPIERVHHRRFLLRGLSSSIIAGNVLNTLSADWAAYLNFINFIGNKPTGGVHPASVPTATALGCRYQDPTSGKFRLTSLANDPNLAYQMIMAGPGIPATAGVKVKISGVPGMAAIMMNRTWNIVGNNLTGVTIGTTKKAIPKFDGNVYTGPGPAFVQQIAPLSGPFDQFAVIGLRSKKTGEALRRLRGKSSRKR